MKIIAFLKRLLNDAEVLGGSRYDRLRDRLFTGHVRVGPVVIYGANAMHYAINIRTREGYICAHPTTGRNDAWPWYLYVSPNATPQSAWWGIGPGYDGPRSRFDPERNDVEFIGGGRYA